MPLRDTVRQPAHNVSWQESSSSKELPFRFGSPILQGFVKQLLVVRLDINHSRWFALQTWCGHLSVNSGAAIRRMGELSVVGEHPVPLIEGL
jgi:hypothetical protein